MACENAAPAPANNPRAPRRSPRAGSRSTGLFTARWSAFVGAARRSAWPWMDGIRRGAVPFLETAKRGLRGLPSGWYRPEQAPCGSTELWVAWWAVWRAAAAALVRPRGTIFAIWAGSGWYGGRGRLPTPPCVGPCHRFGAASSKLVPTWELRSTRQRMPSASTDQQLRRKRALTSVAKELSKPIEFGRYGQIPEAPQETEHCGSSRSRRRHFHHGLDRICHERQEECELQR